MSKPKPQVPNEPPVPVDAGAEKERQQFARVPPYSSSRELKVANDGRIADLKERITALEAEIERLRSLEPEHAALKQAHYQQNWSTLFATICMTFGGVLAGTAEKLRSLLDGLTGSPWEEAFIVGTGFTLLVVGATLSLVAPRIASHWRKCRRDPSDR